MSPKPIDSHGRSFRDGEVLLERFQIVRFLGQGGMGEVYEAIDFQLGRIALKTINRKIAESEEAIQRFHREVKLARRVTNPHVCRVYDLFTIKARDGHPSITFLTMEHLAGVTLAERIAKSGPLPHAEAERIALQLCSAVQSVHEAGIIHRDLKTRNIILVSSRDGAGHEAGEAAPPHAVVMDFGLARESRNEDTGLTRFGAVMGTPEYMAPEQAQGKEVTAAADIYSLGVVLFEMLTGRLPSDAPTASLTASTGKTPAKPAVPYALPHRWSAVIHRCLLAQPELRFQTATDLAEALKESPSRRRLKVSVAAAVIVFAIGVITLFRSPVMRQMGISSGARAGSLRATSVRRVLIAQIENHTGEAVFDQTMGELLRSTLDQSSVIKVYPATELAAALRRMGKPETTEIDADLAIDLCQREGLYAAITGSITRVGTEFVVILRALDGRGTVISSGTDSARSQEQVISVIDQISKAMRKNLGESAESVTATVPLEKVTSPSLQAIEYYSLGRIELSKGKAQNAINLFQRAIEIDPNFAMAHAYAGIAYEYQGDSIAMRRELATAASLSDRVAEPERLKILGDYSLAQRNFSQAAKYYQLLSQIRPEIAAAHLNMGQAFLGQFDFDRALAETERAIRLQPSVGSEDNAVEILFESGRTDESMKRADRHLKSYPDDSRALYFLGRSLLARGDTEAARKVFLRMSLPGAEGQSTGDAALADLALDRGHLDEARSHLQDALVTDEKAHNLYKSAMRTLQLLGVAQRSGQTISNTVDFASIQGDDRLLIVAANLCANESNAACLGNIIAMLELHRVSGESASGQSFLGMARSELALVQHQRSDAVEFAESAVQFENSAFALDLLARTYAALSMDQQAISAYGKVLSRASERMEAYDGPAYHRLREIHEALAQLYSRTGDKRLSDRYKAFAAR